jgi:hypothetical protein
MSLLLLEVVRATLGPIFQAQALRGYSTGIGLRIEDQSQVVDRF